MSVTALSVASSAKGSLSFMGSVGLFSVGCDLEAVFTTEAFFAGLLSSTLFSSLPETSGAVLGAFGSGSGMGALGLIEVSQQAQSDSIQTFF
jgi:hypothetical protein